MTEEYRMIIGIDLGRRCSQICYYIEGMKNPQSVEGGYGTVLHESDEVLKEFFVYVIQETQKASGRQVYHKIAVSLDNFNKALLDRLKQLLLDIGIEEDRLCFVNRTESFIYYMLNESYEIYQRGAGLFDYNERRLKYTNVDFAQYNNKTVVMAETAIMETKNEELEDIDSVLLKCAKELMGNKAMSSVFFTGYGFEEDESHFDQFLKYVCNRKRGFMGQNLYCHGAALAVWYQYYGDEHRDKLIACEDRILADVEIEICEKETPKIYKLVRAGSNWYSCNKQVRFILDDIEEIRLHIVPIENKPDSDVIISLKDIPKRPSKMTKLQLSIEFTDARSCNITIKDMGFGDYYRAVGKDIVRQIKL